MRFIILLLLLTSFSVSAQQDTVFVRYNKDWSEEVKYVTDTLVYESPLRRHLLIGTTALPGTHNQMTAYNNGLIFREVLFTECEGSVEGGSDKINTINIDGDMVLIDMTIYDNCCYSFLCDAGVNDEGILNLIYYGYGSNCTCSCCFGLKYNFTIDNIKDASKVKAVMINGDKSTLKKIKL
jgi:hypothetical protein